jgi:hypothetical protein
MRAPPVQQICRLIVNSIWVHESQLLPPSSEQQTTDIADCAEGRIISDVFGFDPCELRCVGLHVVSHRHAGDTAPVDKVEPNAWTMSIMGCLSDTHHTSPKAAADRDCAFHQQRVHLVPRHQWLLQTPMPVGRQSRRKVCQTWNSWLIGAATFSAE